DTVVDDLPRTLCCQHPRALDDNFAAGLPAPVRHGVVTAALDLLAHTISKPLAQLLGATTRRSVPIAAVVSTPEAAASAVARGIGCLKVKAGVDSPTHDLERIAAIRQAAPHARLRVDANGAWTRELARDIGQALAPMSLEWIEQPLAASDITGLCRLRSQISTPIAVDETLADPGFRAAALAKRAGDVLVLKPSAIGGVFACLDLHAEAQRCGLASCISFAWTSAVGQHAALHLAAALPGPLQVCGLANPWARDVAQGACATPDGGGLCVPQTPGLGLRWTQEAA
ncbi:MAG: mandelate racemase/muconate lactonizing enzyme family protein, partial [Nannocystaceae bacterium]